MILYPDSSVIVPLFAPEASSPAIAALLEATDDVAVSDFGIGETCSAISRKARERHLTEAQAIAAFQKVDLWAEHVARTIEVSSVDVRRATALVRMLSLKLRFPDALQLAVAERIDAVILTRDRLLADAAQALSLPSQLLP